MRFVRTLAVTAALLGAIVPARSRAICRVVEPPREGADPGVAFDPTTSALYVLAPDQLVDATCPGGAAPVDGWCGDVAATPVHDTLVSLVVQPAILARGGSAGLVMPVPARPDVARGEADLVDAAAALAVYEVEETVQVREDPSLGYQCSDPHFSAVTPGSVATAMWGCGEYYRPGTEGRAVDTIDYGDAGTVDTETIQTSDAYDVTVIGASSLDALIAWMDDHGFAHDEADHAAFGAYVGEDHWFVAVRVRPEDLGGVSQRLDPIVVTWRGAALPLTHRLQYDPDGGTIVTDAWVIAPSRRDAPSDSGFTSYAAPTTFAGTRLAGFGLDEGWLTHVEMTRIASQPLEDEELVRGQEEVLRPTLSRTVSARIAAPCCPGGRTAPSDPSAFRTHTYARTYLSSEAPPIPAEWLGSTPPPGRDVCGGETFGLFRSDDRPDLRGCAAGGGLSRALLGWGPFAAAALLLVARRRRR